MDDQCEPIICTDDTQPVTMYIPCRLVERAKKYATENGNTVTGVVIEALDAFLRSQMADSS